MNSGRSWNCGIDIEMVIKSGRSGCIMNSGRSWNCGIDIEMVIKSGRSGIRACHRE